MPQETLVAVKPPVVETRPRPGLSPWREPYLSGFADGLAFSYVQNMHLFINDPVSTQKLVQAVGRLLRGENPPIVITVPYKSRPQDWRREAWRALTDAARRYHVDLPRSGSIKSKDVHAWQPPEITEQEKHDARQVQEMSEKGSGAGRP